MSTENRNKVLLGFGALVAVVIVAIALWPANFRKEDASGAIGAVQKHRAPQITQKDVILGDETVRHQQKVLYADFLADAAKLRAMAASAKYDSAIEFANELSARFASEAEAALAEAEMAARGARANTAEIAEMRAILNRKQLSDSDIQQFNTRLAHVAEMSAKSMSRSILADADREIELAVKHLEIAKLEDEYLAVAKQIQDAEALLSRPVANISLADEVIYLNEILMESRAVAAKHLADQEYASRISRAAEQLEAMATKNIQASAELMSEMAARLKDMDALMARASRLVGSRAGVQAGSIEMLNKNLAEARKALLSRENEFYARANAAASEEFLAARTLNSVQLQSELANLQSQLRAKQAQ